MSNGIEIEGESFQDAVAAASAQLGLRTTELGIEILDPGASADTPYEAQAPLLPKTLEEALGALRTDACLAEGFGRNFIDYYLRIKEAEIARYNAEVTEWEQREYFELF